MTVATRRAPTSRASAKINAPSSATEYFSPPGTRIPDRATPPANYLPPTPPPSSLKEKTEQGLIPRSGKSIFHELSHHLRKHRFALHGEYHPIHIANVSPANFEAFLTAHCHDDLLKGIDLEYDSFAGEIIMCPPPAPYHDCMPVFLQDVLVGLRSTSFDTPARQRTLSVREIRFRSPSGSYMVPDAAVVVMSRDGDVRVWPTIVVEVANSQEYDSVLQKARRWFVQSDGMVEVVLVMKFTAKDPLMDPACYLEVWRYGEVVAIETGDSDSDSDVPMDVDSDNSGEEIMDDNTNEDAYPANGQTGPRDDAHPPDTTIDTVVPADDDCDSSLSLLSSSSSSSSDHQTERTEDNHPGDASTDIPGLADQVSDSSLSSLSSHSPDQSGELDPAAYEQSQGSVSTASQPPSASPNSPGDYDPHPAYDIILSGARKTVLPIADPADPEMRYLPLRYSDFFGSENVPPGQDPTAEVLLDLDELREEIEMLMRMTAKQEQPVAKRQADGADADPGSKRIRR